MSADIPERSHPELSEPITERTRALGDRTNRDGVDDFLPLFHSVPTLDYRIDSQYRPPEPDTNVIDEVANKDQGM